MKWQIHNSLWIYNILYVSAHDLQLVTGSHIGSCEQGMKRVIGWKHGCRNTLYNYGTEKYNYFWTLYCFMTSWNTIKIYSPFSLSIALSAVDWSVHSTNAYPPRFTSIVVHDKLWSWKSCLNVPSFTSVGKFPTYSLLIISSSASTNVTHYNVKESQTY
jgi:hypothetical protein